MISERLDQAKIVFGLKGELAGAIDDLSARSAIPELAAQFRAHKSDEHNERYSYIGDGIALPHLRIDNLAEPELIFGLSRAGLRFNDHKINIVLLLATPAERPAEHLQLLQRISSLLPAIRDELLKQRDAQQIVKLIAQAERQSALPTYINLTQEQIAFELQTDLVSGLTAAEAQSRLRHYGGNLLQRVRREPWYFKLLRNLFSFFAILLWIAALLCFVPGVDLPQLGIAILTVILVNGLFAFLQEYKSDRALELLQQLIAQTSKVVRAGSTTEIAAAELVPGDVIFLEEGDLVPADCRLTEAFEVEVDNSSLTGESTPARRYKSDQPVLIGGKFLWIELPNILFAGTSLLRGRARAVVFGTGMHSEIGKIANLTQEIESAQSPLQKQLRATVYAISALAGGLGFAFLLLGWLVAGLTFLEAFVFFIGLFVANVPEGLLPTVTLSLAMGVQRMAKRHALVKSLPSVETLGCTTVICCDKTGTLTQNLMMATEIAVDGKMIEVSGVGYEPRGNFSHDGQTLSLEAISHWQTLRRLLDCAFICNNAKLEKASAEFRVIGDPTEGALVCLAEKAGLRGMHQRLHLNPFESIRKRMSVVVRPYRHTDATIYVKGAPLETLAQCDRIHWRDEIRPLSVLDRKRIFEENDAMARRGLRVLAFAYRDGAEVNGAPFSAANVEKNLVYLGLVALSDPLRPEVPAAIHACHSAGIRIIMITGDYALTAASIGRQIGLGRDGRLQSFTGAEVSEMDDGRLREILRGGETIFARVAPEHKLRIVALLKQMGEIVAVTGDGVNDAPALKKADIGIAMGLRGNDIAKEASRMILTDDNFSSIVAAIEEGRAVFVNIRRFMAYIFNHNPLEMYPYILWLLFPGVPLAITVMGVLAVDVGTDLIPAMGLGIEPPEDGIMARPPRRREIKLLSIGFILQNYLIQGSIVTFSCFATYLYFGWAIGYWKPWLGLEYMPSGPPALKLEDATLPYLQSLTAYFFPAVTTQLANVCCQRSWQTSILSCNFLNPVYRREALDALARWRPRWLTAEMRTAIVRPAAIRLAKWLERHPIVFNFVSNPLVDLGILFELLLCYLFFYTPLAEIYYFAPVPWHVYLFACHGTILLFAFEECKKDYRRKGFPLEFLG
jgi:sodium/potassium-transporting ATPase subunit alpha